MSVEQSVIEDNSMVLQTWIESNNSLFSRLQESRVYVCLNQETMRVSSVQHQLSNKWKKNIIVFCILLSGTGKYMLYLSSVHVPSPSSPTTISAGSSPIATPTSSTASLPAYSLSSNSNGTGTITIGQGGTVSHKMLSNLQSYFSSASQQSLTSPNLEGAQYIMVQSIQRALQRYISTVKSDTVEYNKIIHYKKHEGNYLPTLYLQPLANGAERPISPPPLDPMVQETKTPRGGIPLIVTPDMANEANINTPRSPSPRSPSPQPPSPQPKNRLSIPMDGSLHFKNGEGLVRLSSSPNSGGHDTLEANDDSTLSICSSDSEDETVDHSSCGGCSRQNSASATGFECHPLSVHCLHNTTNQSTVHFKKITPILTSSIGSIRASKSPQHVPITSAMFFNHTPLVSSVSSSSFSASLSISPPPTVTTPVSSLSRTNSQLTTSLPLTFYELGDKSTGNANLEIKTPIPTLPSLQIPSFSPPMVNGFGSFKPSRTISSSKDLPERTSMLIGDTSDGRGAAGMCSLYGWDYENKIRSGEPFADSFCIDIDLHPCIKASLTIADGSGHGEEPQKAARLAVLGANEYLENHTKEVRTTNDLMTLLGNATLRAHDRIVSDEYYTSQEIHIEPKGATTFCIGALCKLKDSLNNIVNNNQSNAGNNAGTTTTITTNSPETSPNTSWNVYPTISQPIGIVTSNISAENNPVTPPNSYSQSLSPPSGSTPGVPTSPPIQGEQWIVLVASVGDSKAFRWSAATGNVSEITNTTSKERNFNDAGGQLGWMFGGEDKFWPLESLEYPQHQREDVKDILLEARREKAQPHLKNLHFAMALLNPGDRVFITSDGISDNFLNNNETQRRTHRDEIEYNLTKFLKSQPSESLATCDSMVQAIISFCVENTQHFRSIQEEMSKCLLKMKEIEKSGCEDISKSDSQYHIARKTHSKLSNSIRTLKNGKPDHASIVMYEVPKPTIPN